MEWLKKLLQGDPGSLPLEIGQDVPVSGDRDLSKLNKMRSPVDVTKSEALGQILEGIPNVSGYPITKEAEELAKIPKNNAPTILPEMVITAPKAVNKVKSKVVTQDIPLRGKPDVLQPMETPAMEPEAPQPAKPTVTPTPEVQPQEDELSKLQDDRRNMMLMQAILRAANTANTAIAGVKPNQQYLSEYDQLIQEPISSYKERTAAAKAKTDAERETKKFEQDFAKNEIYMEKLKNEAEDEKALRDPNSIISEATRQFQEQRMKTLSEASGGKIKYAPGMFDGMSASRLEASLGKVSPENLAGILMQNEARREDAKARREESALRREESRQRYEESMGLKREQQETKQNLENQKQIERYTNTLQKSEPFKESERIVLATQKVRELAKDAATRGGQSLAMLGPAVAKGLAGEVGVLTDKDVTRYTQNPSAVGGLVDTLTKVKAGKLSQVSYDNLMRLTEIMEKKALEARKQAYAKGATQLSRNSSLSYEKAYEMLDPNYTPGDEVPSVGQSATKAQFPMQVRKGNQVATVSNEQELKEAREEGFN